MIRYNWKIGLGIILIILSAIVYTIHFIIFRDIHHIFIYLIGDIAFVFINVLLVTLVIDTVLDKRDKKDRLEKLNMLVGVFFSEVGTKLLVHFSDSDPNLEKIKENLVVDVNWSKEKFMELSKNLKS